MDQLATTDMGCPQNLADQDKWLSDLLMASPTLAFDGNDLVLTSDKTEITLIDREKAEPDQPLTGITWSLATVIDGDSRIVRPRRDEHEPAVRQRKARSRSAMGATRAAASTPPMATR